MEAREPGSDFGTAFNCLLCCFALGDREKMKQTFVRMLTLELADEDRYLNVQDDAQVGVHSMARLLAQLLVLCNLQQMGLGV
jgi:hypothetical protein